MRHQWIYKALNEEESDISAKIAQELSVNPILSKLLVQRNIKTFEEARAFFRPELSDLHDPFLMKDMANAVKRLTRAVRKREKILIYGDYDVDGTTSVALVYRFLIQYHSHIDYYIPDRYSEGYGISYQGIDYAKENDFSLVVALDCGIKAVEKIAYANEKGIDFIICDHHTPGVVLPDAVAVLDTKRKDCGYPYKELSGCGVGFKLMQAFALENRIEEQQLLPLLDLVALSVASDIVPITGENRVLAFYGLKQLNYHPSVGVKAIIDVCGLEGKEINISDIVFKIGPRINASGRMKSGNDAVELLISNDYADAKKKGSLIDSVNEDRKSKDKSITEEAIALINNDEKYIKRRSIVVYKADWHKGIVGIVASRLTEEYYKPTIVLAKSNGLVSGSARSVQGFDIYKAIASCKDLLENFGGHIYAAGLTLEEENLPLFMERFEQFVEDNITEEQTYPQIDIDAELPFSHITPKFFKILKQFSPFGPGNMKPYFVTKRVRDYGNSRVVGRDNEHLKMELVDEHSEQVMSGIAFRMAEHNEALKRFHPLDVCYTLEENNYNGNSSIQLMIKDIKESE